MVVVVVKVLLPLDKCAASLPIITGMLVVPVPVPVTDIPVPAVVGVVPVVTVAAAGAVAGAICMPNKALLKAKVGSA